MTHGLEVYASPMHLGILEVRLHVPDAHSLKDKRRVVRSLLDRARNRFGVAAAEVEANEKHRIAVLGFAAVSGSQRHAREIVDKLLQWIRAHPAVRVIEFETDAM